MRSEIHPGPQTSMTKKACNTRLTIQRTTRKVPAFAFHTCRLALTLCSTNHHWCLPKNRSHKRTRLETRCTSTHGAGLRMTARENVSQTHTSSEKRNAKQHVFKTEQHNWTEDTVKVQKMLIHRHRLEDRHMFLRIPVGIPEPNGRISKCTLIT